MSPRLSRGGRTGRSGILALAVETVDKLQTGKGQLCVDLVDGLGVGLSVVQRSVELHMGKIEVTSKLGMGSNFTFWLPAKEVKM